MDSSGASLPPPGTSQRSTTRPGLQTEFDRLAPSSLTAAAQTPIATTPDALAFYRQRSSSALSNNAINGTGNPTPVANRHFPDRSALRSASNPAQSPAPPGQPQYQQHRVDVKPKTSFKDLVARFDQHGSAPALATAQPLPRSASAGPPAHSPSSIPQPLSSSRPRPTRRDSETMTGISEHTGYDAAPPQHQHRRQRSNSFATNPPLQARVDSRDSVSQAPLFGEIFLREATGGQPGHGIHTPSRRRGSDTSTMHRPNAMFPPAQNDSHRPESRGNRRHQRSASSISNAGSITLPAFAADYSSWLDAEDQYGIPQAPSNSQRPLGQSQSHSRIPVKTASRPTTPVSSQHKRNLSYTTPTKHQSTSPRRQGMSPARLSSNGPRLKAKIVAPEPKQSPPLRSSRPRQHVNEVSASNSWSRGSDLSRRDNLAASASHGIRHDFLADPAAAASTPPKSHSPDQRTFFERAVDVPGNSQTLNSATYSSTVPRLKLDTLDAQAAPGAHEEPLTGATEIEDDSFVDAHSLQTGATLSHHQQSKPGNGDSPRLPRSVLSQVLELRRRNTHQYSMPGSYESAQPEDDSGTIQIMLGGTPLLDKHDHDWAAELHSPNMPSERQQLSDNDRLGPSAWTSSGGRETQRSLSVRPNSAAYSIIDNILNEYLDRGSLTPRMLHQFTQQIQEIEPDITEEDGYNPEEVARATLQGLINEVKPLHRSLTPPQPILLHGQNPGTQASHQSGHSRIIQPRQGSSGHHQAQSDRAKRVGYQTGTSRPPIFTTGSHNHGQNERTGPLSAPSIQPPAPMEPGVSLPDSGDIRGSLGGAVDPNVPRVPPIPPAPPLLLHELYERSRSTPPSSSGLQADVQGANGRLMTDSSMMNGKPSQSTSINSTSEPPSISDQGKGASSSSIRSQEDSVKEEKRLNTRRMVIKELVDTEFSYSADMKILEDIYMATGRSTDAISDDDQRVLFGNMHEIVAFTMAFQDTLKRAAAPVYSRPREKRFAQPQLGADGRASMSTSNSGADAPSFQEPADDQRDRQTTVGAAFWQHMTKFEKVYGDYMRNHSSANERYLKIKDQRGVQAWINECKEYARDLTDAWDLDSLLVKPTQRMMKYHMILDSLLQKTPDDHPDKELLQGAITELKAATSRINESKKRSDLLDQINNPRKRSDVSLGISKVLGRRQDKLRQQIGLTEAADDADFLSVNEKYGGYYLKLQVVMRDFDSYKQKTDMFMAQFNALIDTWEQTMDVEDRPVYAEIESKWRRAAATIREMTQIAWVDHEAAVQRHCIDPLLAVIKLNEKTQKFLQKRRKRIPEYAKYKTMVSRGDKPDKKTQEAADQYIAYTDSLKEELPKLYQLTNTLIGKCLHNFVDIQKLWHVTWRRKLLTILDEQRVPGSMEEILEVLRSDWQAPYTEVQQLGICNGSILQQAANFLSFPSERDSRQITSGQSSRRTTAGSQQAPSFSSPELAQGRMSEQSSQTTLVPLSQNGQRLPFPTSLEEARNAPAKYAAVTTSGAPSHVRESHDFEPANPVRSSQPAHVGRVSVNSFAPHQPVRPSSSSTYYTAAAYNQPPYQGDSPAKPNVFSSAMPMPDSPVQASSPSTSQAGESREEVLFVAASLFEFHINQPRQEAGFRYLTYIPGEIFDVLGEKGELWLARNQDDPTKDVGWIWEKHFAKVVDM